MNVAKKYILLLLLCAILGFGLTVQSVYAAAATTASTNDTTVISAVSLADEAAGATDNTDGEDMTSDAGVTDSAEGEDASGSTQDTSGSAQGSTQAASTTLSTPKLTAISNTATGVKVTWGAVDGAQRYRIYRKISDGSWKAIGETENTSFTDTTAVSGVTYTYTVCCISVDGSTRTSKYSATGKSIYYVAAPTLSSVKGSAKGVTVAWEKVNGAKKYRVYRKTSGGSWTKLGETTSTSFVDTTAKTGKTYIYTVRCINSSGTSFTSSYDHTGLTISYLATPTLSGIEAKSTGIKVSWKSVSGAKKYRIYRKTSGGSWKKVGETTSTSFTDTTAKTGKTYLYTVRCIDSGTSMPTSGYDTAGISLTYLATPTLSGIKAGNKGVTVTWESVSKAKKYRVYRKTSGGSWKKVGETTSTSFTDTTAKTGKTYIYTVRCISSSGKTFTSGYDSTGLTISYKATPTLEGATYTSSGIKVSWKSVSGVTKYRVYRKTKNGSWTRLATVSDTSYTDTTAKSGKVYYYTVRCVSDDGKTLISGYNTTGCSTQTSRVIQNGNIYYYDSNGVLYRTVYGDQKMVALTYDDGPSYYTETILDVLEEYNSVATFFVVGERVSTYSSILAREYALNCQIGNHTYDHSNLANLSSTLVKSQISQTNTAIENVIGVSPTVMRPPYGSYNSTVKSAVGMPLILWSIDTLDWKTRDATSTINSVLNNVKDGDIILMHDLYAATATATETIVPSLIKKGYQLVTIEEMSLLRGGMSNGSVYYSFR